MRWQPWALAFAGLFPAFFLVFAGVFSDGPSGLLHPERLLSYALVLLAYGLLAFVGLWQKIPWKQAALALGIPAGLLLALYTVREPGTLVLSLLYALVVAAGMAVAVGLDRALARRRAA